MKDQDILDYLNTNNYEKETLIKKILYKRIKEMQFKKYNRINNTKRC